MMVLKIPMSEAVGIIRQKTGMPIAMKVISGDTVNVGCEVTVKIPIVGKVTKTIGVDIIIDMVKDYDVFFHYSSGLPGADKIIDKLMDYIPHLKDNSVVEKLGNGNMTAHLKEIPQMKEALEKIEIASVAFGDDAIIVGFKLLVENL